MIQRIQTVYLLIVAALTVVMLFMPLAVVQLANDFYTLDASGLSTMTAPSELVVPMWALMALASIITLIAFVAIFLYKKRILQIRFCIYNSILLIGFYGLFVFYVWRITGESDFFHFSPRIALGFPLVSLILNCLAIRNIGADEALVRSLERLR
ncbi:MAG: DUF4293 domain-containing protein [Tannerella sp.]|jgi:hypothetical protein|nr:DUF4293 domain-containing protein [Tannerella sp.]